MGKKGSRQAPLGLSSLIGLNEAILELNDPRLTADGVLDRAAKRCEGLIAHSTVWVACSDLRERSISCYYGPWAQQAIDLAPAFGFHLAEHPQFMALCRGIAQPVDSVSDYVSLRQWRSSGMFREVVKLAGAIDQLSSSILLGENLSFSVVINRDRWGFGDEERLVLELFTPHVAQAWRNRVRWEQQLHLATSREWVVDHFGNVIDAGDGLDSWLAANFPEEGSGISRAALPKPVRTWISQTLIPMARMRGTPSVADLTMDFPDAEGRLYRFQLSPGQSFARHVVSVAPVIRSAAEESQRLLGLGLSPRQAEVLLWLSRGKSNDEIAAILGISLFTVKAHLRAIFPILMVDNRHAAATRAWHEMRR
jgi:DNA-binding CsgD family transcriptional regulator